MSGALTIAEIDGSGHESTTECPGSRARRCVWLECCGELLVVCEPVLRFFCETTHNDRAQTLRDRPVERVGRGRRIVRHRHQQRDQVRPDKGSATGEQLEQRGAYAVDVAARVERGAVKLLRRGIAWGPDDMSDRGELRRVDGRTRRSRNPEIADLDEAVVADEAVRGLDIAMQNAAICRGREPLSNLENRVHGRR